MQNKILRNALILLFCGYIFVFALLYIFLPAQDFSEKEKRVLAAFPEVSLETVFNGTFESGFETWLSDHLPGRDAFVGMNSLYEQASGRNGLSGVIASGDRLFAAPEAFDPDAVARKCGFINRLAEKTLLPVDMMIVPTAGYMYEDSLPALHAGYHDSAVMEHIAASLAPSVNLIPLEGPLRAALSENLYYRTDHHLTARGSYEAASVYMDAIGKSLPAANNYAIETVEGFYGSMYAKSGLWNTAPDDIELWRSAALGNVTVSFDDRESADSLFFTEHLSAMDKYPVFLDGNHGLVTIENDAGNGETLLIVRDSFGHCFAPFAADVYSRVTLVDLRYYRKGVSSLAADVAADRILVLYGMDTFLTDTNFAWLT
ncbi:MAG: hypothetical protein E7337_08375 [Clostridiales bacterium]|nr:hypothetical protein [Clostridiales bacterium]